MAASKRLKQLPDVPTVMESGVPDYEGNFWLGIVAPTGTAHPILDKLAAASKRVVERPEIQARFDKDAVEPVGNTPAEFKALITREIAQWRNLAKQTEIKIE